jgi:uncharacterized protein (TIRG00374 family)
MVVIGVLALGLLALFLRGADLSRVWSEMRTARPGLLVLAVVLTLVLYVIRAQRWQYLLAPLGPTRFHVAFRATVIGFAASAVLPARAGEVLRPLLLARREGLPPTAAFATIVVERILDLAAVLLLLATYLLLFDAGMSARAPALYEAVRLGAWVTTVAVLGLLVMMAVLAADPTRLHRLLLRAERILPARLARSLARLARTFAEGLAIVRRPGRLLASMGLSIAIWVLIASQAWIVSAAFRLRLPYAGSYLLTAMLVVGIALPTPGGVGGFHEAFRLGATSFFGADNDAAVGAAIVLHAVSLMPVVLMGIWFAFADGLDFGRLKHLSEKGEEGEGPLTPPGTKESRASVRMQARLRSTREEG